MKTTKHDFEITRRDALKSALAAGMASHSLLVPGLAFGCAGAFAGVELLSPFTTSDDEQRLIVMEGGKPVFVYNYAPVAPPTGVSEKFRRANYLHPVHGPDGSVVTEDFPADHHHHRGIFWAWPNCSVNDRKLNVWELDGARTVFQRWSGMDSSRTLFRVQAQNVWRFDDDGFAPIEERAWLMVHALKDGQRVIDFDLSFKNIVDADVVFQGSAAAAGSAGAGAKGYGGFCYRPDAANTPFTFTAAEGRVSDDRMSCETPWVDISWGTGQKRGVTMIQHRDNPGYPHPGWMLRHYGFLGASWPHTASHTLNPGESFALRYRVIVHEGDAQTYGAADAAAAFAQGR
ncbi:MAG: DUF6807 family protein [Candidatus Hydrogenedentes bacterium]|nr:DUF6807 family protein [Candidatus Hydrogenedentota bacterium]